MPRLLQRPNNDTALEQRAY